MSYLQGKAEETVKAETTPKKEVAKAEAPASNAVCLLCLLCARAFTARREAEAFPKSHSLQIALSFSLSSAQESPCTCSCTRRST